MTALELPRASGVSEHGADALTTDGGHLVAFATVPGADGGVRLVYGLVADADAVVHDVAAGIVARQALLPLAPLEGAVVDQRADGAQAWLQPAQEHQVGRCRRALPGGVDGGVGGE